MVCQFEISEVILGHAELYCFLFFIFYLKKHIIDHV